MAQTKRTPNAQKNKNQAGAKTSSQRGRASAAKSTAQARSGGGRAATRAPQSEPARGEYANAPVLDDGARNDIAGVVIAVLGLALLIAVLTPTSGVLTQAVSDILHALFGLGAFLVPVALLVWAVTFFVHLPQLVPGRVAVGLLLIACAVMGLLGICTTGAEADPARLFNAYVLADRGGYLGNGLAWLLLTLTGKVVGIVVLVGLIVAGLIVIGWNVGQTLQSLRLRVAERRTYTRLRTEERAAASARAQNAAWNAQVASGMPADYAPTALFDPNRPLTVPRGAAADPYMQVYQGAPMPQPGSVQTTYMAPDGRIQTTYIPFDQAAVPMDPRMPVVNPVQAPATTYLSNAVAPAPYFGCGEQPMASGAQASDDVVERIMREEEASRATSVSFGSSSEEGLGLVRAASVSFDPRAAESRVAADPGVSEVGEPERSVRTRVRSTWWDPEDDENRDDFDPTEVDSRPHSSFVPGVLPGAPVDAVEVTSAPSVEPEPEVAPDVRVDALGDDAASRVTTRTKAAFKAQEALDAARAPHGASAPVELPWEPARVNAGLDRSSMTARTLDPSAPFQLPDPSIMTCNEQGIEKTPEQRREAANMAKQLQSTLGEFGVKAEVVDWVDGPTCTTYRVNPGEGVRVNRFTSLEDDIARALARDSVRIYAPVPGTSYVGIEVPNTSRQMVYFGDVLPYVTGGPLDFAVGLDAGGKPVHVDLAKLPHILIAGTTGSGKSVMVNTIIMSFLMRDTPQEVRLIMIDPKQVEFKDYDGIPHLIMPVITDMRQAAAALQWGVTEMDRRYRLFSNIGVRDLKGYSKLVADGAFASAEFPLQDLPSIVIVIDELADLMMVAKKDVEASIVRIAQLGRACGIHLVMATQSPRADVVTGLIRANVANRIGLKVAKGTDSKIVIDQTGAEKLLGNGDMLFLQTAWGDKPRRIQGCWLADSEIAQVVEHLKNQPAPEYNNQMAPLPGTQLVADFSDDPMGSPGGKAVANDDDPVAWRAAQLVVEHQLGSTSMIQRQLKLGYARAGRIMDMLEEMGVVGPANGSKPRDVLIRDLEELATIRGDFDGSEEDY